VVLKVLVWDIPSMKLSVFTSTHDPRSSFLSVMGIPSPDLVIEFDEGAAGIAVDLLAIGGEVEAEVVFGGVFVDEVAELLQPVETRIGGIISINPKYKKDFPINLK
jgi:hypothetical protein